MIPAGPKEKTTVSRRGRVKQKIKSEQGRLAAQGRWAKAKTVDSRGGGGGDDVRQEVEGQQEQELESPAVLCTENLNPSPPQWGAKKRRSCVGGYPGGGLRVPASVTASKENISMPIMGADLADPSIPCESMASAARVLHLDGIPPAKDIVHQQEVISSRLQRLAAPLPWQQHPLARKFGIPRRIEFDK